MKLIALGQRFMLFATGLALLLGTGACSPGGSSGGGTPAPAASVTLTVSTVGSGTGTVTSNPAGLNCGTTCTLTVTSGTLVTLTASPASGNTLANWGGACPAGSATCAVTVSSNQTVTATFDISSANPSLNFTFAGTGAGSITCNGGVCSATYPWGASVTVSGIADVNSSFAGWSGAGCSGTADCTIVLWADTQLTASFNLLPVTAQLSVSTTGNGAGTITSVPAGINCGATCLSNYPGGTVVILNASAAAGSTFAGWSGGGCSGTGACDVTLNADMTVTATFNTVPPTVTFSLTTFGTGTGTITCNGAACQPSYPSGTALAIVAAPAVTSLFSGWGGDCAVNGTTATCNLTVNANTAVSAAFNLPTLSVVVAGTGTVTSTPAGIDCGTTCMVSFNRDTSITLSAAPVAGMTFSGWSGGGCAGTGPCVVILTDNFTVTATFGPVTAFCPAEATLVKDIAPTTGSAFATSGNELVDVNGTLFFVATDGVAGFELWKSDGTDAGTVLVKDIVAGSGSSDPANLTNVNGTLFFFADDGVHGAELWKSDGTAAGTVLVKDINLSGSSFFTSSGFVTSLVAIGDTLYFTPTDGVNGVELWKSDGTEVGTILVQDIRPGALNSSPDLLTVVNGTLFFVANDGVNGSALWKTTAAGTVMVKDLNVSPSDLTSSNGLLFFQGNSGELWRSDGSEAGTVLVKAFNAGSAFPQELTDVNGTLYFLSQSLDTGVTFGLYKSDGTTVGTVLVATLSGANELRSIGGKLFFRGATPLVGNQPYISDGTAGGTGVLKSDLFLLGIASGVPWFTDVNGTAFFAANDGVTGVELWKSDGTAAGTVLVKDIVLGGSSGPTNLTKVDRKLFFIAGATGLGRELWVVCGAP